MCGMAPSKQINREQRFEMEKLRKEKRAAFHYDIAKLSFGGMVIGGIIPMFADFSSVNNLIITVLGAITTFYFADLGDKTLRRD